MWTESWTEKKNQSCSTTKCPRIINHFCKTDFFCTRFIHLLLAIFCLDECYNNRQNVANTCDASKLIPSREDLLCDQQVNCSGFCKLLLIFPPFLHLYWALAINKGQTSPAPQIEANPSSIIKKPKQMKLWLNVKRLHKKPITREYCLRTSWFIIYWRILFRNYAKLILM